MQAIVPYAIWAALILSALTILAIALYSMRGLFYGKADALTIGLMVVPVVVFAVLGLLMETWALAGIWTTIIMAALAALALLYTGVRGTVT